MNKESDRGGSTRLPMPECPKQFRDSSQSPIHPAILKLSRLIGELVALEEIEKE